MPKMNTTAHVTGHSMATVVDSYLKFHNLGHTSITVTDLSTSDTAYASPAGNHYRAFNIEPHRGWVSMNSKHSTGIARHFPAACGAANNTSCPNIFTHTIGM